MAIHEIRVQNVNDDTLGREVRDEVRRSLSIDGLDEVHTSKVYRLQGISESEARMLARHLLSDPVSEQFAVNSRLPYVSPLVAEVAYRPGVMNPEAESIIKAAHDLGVTDIEAADSSTEYAFVGKIGIDELNKIMTRLLVNKTVQMPIYETPETLLHEGKSGPINIIPVISATEADLKELSKDKLFLNADEMRAIQEHFMGLGRNPTDAELEIIAARWSEHCGHKTFNAKVIVDGVEKEPLFKRIKDAATAQFGDKVVSAFADNSGVIRFYDGMAICGKVETHNSPSAIEPYGGAMTGSGGVFRDVMGTGQGAKTIISTDMFCLGPPDLEEASLPEGCLHPDYIQRRVVQGVRDYGNRMGIPTGNGSLHFHPDFRAKPTVIVGAYGILPENRAEKGEPQMGDQVVVIGGRTGRDGIHGATFSSGEMTERTINVNSSAVQIGNAIEEKRMFDALLAARDEGLIRALTDCGAAGFSSAIGELGEDIGVTVDISKAPLKYAGLDPWEIWLSESQERMAAAIAPYNIEAFLEICRMYNVEATVLGEFDGSHTLTVNYGDQNVAELDYEFLKHGLPERVMHAHWEQPAIDDIKPDKPRHEEVWIDRFKAVLSHGNVCSKEPIVRQYDHGVQGGNVVSPFGGITQEGPNDALVVRPILGKPYGVVQSHGMNPILNRIDPYEGSVWATTEALSNYVAVGGNPEEVALVNNYIWPYPDEEAMGSLDRSVDAVVHMMGVLKAPVISGKDSLSSTYRGKDGEVIKIPPVLCMSAFGGIPDVEITMTSDIKKPGKSILYLVGYTSEGMGGSTYYDVTGGSSADIPLIDLHNINSVLKSVHNGINSGNVLACHDVSEGGVATAVAEMTFGGQCGMKLQIPKGKDPETFLFSETAGCFIVEVESEDAAIQAFGGVPHVYIGDTSKTSLFNAFQAGNGRLFTADVGELQRAWQQPTKEIFHT
jgi:phosphoribosylformylglycinamidine synthase subunit PurSL